MARSAVVKKRSTPPPPAPEVESGPRMVGDKVVELPLDRVTPNDWNPNRFSSSMLASLKHGLLADGWLRSQSLLIWGTDEKGEAKNIIIDGEHRWQVAKELGFTKAPMVFMHGLTSAQAKALTIKLDSKRGKFDPTDLASLVRDIQFDLNVPDLALDLGIESEALMSMLVTPDLPLDDPKPADSGDMPGIVPSGMAAHVKMVQLFFNEETHAEFSNLVKELAPGFNTKDVTSTTLEAMRRAATARTAPKPHSERRASRG